MGMAVQKIGMLSRQITDATTNNNLKTDMSKRLKMVLFLYEIRLLKCPVLHFL